MADLSKVSVMDDSGKKRLPSDSSLRRFIKSALGLALATAPLRNELHAWLIKLTSRVQQPQLATLPPSEHATPLRQVRAVQMLTICCCCFLPEDSALTNVLRSHVARVAAADDIMLEQLQGSFEQMLASVVGRTLPPSLAEARAILECRTAATPVHVTSFTVKTAACHDCAGSRGRLRSDDAPLSAPLSIAQTSSRFSASCLRRPEDQGIDRWSRRSSSSVAQTTIGCKHSRSCGCSPREPSSDDL